MRTLSKKFFCGVLSLIMITSILCSSASAATQSSEYLNGYAASVTPIGKGAIVVTVDVLGVGSMTEIGAKVIYIYESADNKSFSQVATFDCEDYPNMMGSGYYYNKDAITYQGTKGYYYYASVYVYAANENGSDLKHYTTSSKRAT